MEDFSKSLKGITLKKKRRPKAAPKRRKKQALGRDSQILDHHTEVHQLKKSMQKLWDLLAQNEERIQDLEVHVNLVTRLITTLCIEKMGMRIGVLKRLIKRIEKEAIRDSQILHLEELYKMPARADKKNPAPQPPSKSDPWEEIS